MHKIYPFLSILLFAALFCRAQTEIPTGAWRTHVNYTSAEKIALAGDKIFCSSKNGLFYFDTEDNSLQQLSKLTGLSDAGISAMQYFTANKLLVLGYKNGNIDFITQDSVANLDIIKHSGLEPFKKHIFNITENNGLAYFSTGAGVVVVDLGNFRVRETYGAIGPAGAEIEAYQTAFYHDSIFVASNIGILAAPFNAATNLLDFNNWQLHGSEHGLPPGIMKGIVNYNDGLVAYSGENIYRYNGHWLPFHFQPEEQIQNINTPENKLLLSLNSSVVVVDGETIENYSEGLLSPVYAVSDDEQLWIADNRQGLMHYQSGKFELIVPEGPSSPNSFNAISHGSNMAVVHGSYDQSLPAQATGFDVFDKGQWKNFSSKAEGPQKIPETGNLVNGDYDVFSGNMYFASFGNGVLAWKKDGTFEVINENSPGSTLKKNDDGELLISDVKTEASEIWLLNYGNANSLHRWDGETNWEAFNVGTFYPVSLLNTRWGHQWLTVDPAQGGGMVVFNPETGLSRRLTTSRGNGGLPDNDVTAIAEDHNGEIWVGTAGGIVFFPQPQLALENEDGTFYAFDANFPIVEDDIFLRDQFINDIMVDPGNRKWVATSEGVWVTGRNGSELAIHFNEENSPLPSDNVLKTEMNEATGEVFFITDRGMVSFRSDASAPKSDYSAVKIFPNPVYPTKTGLVTISGLTENAVVKITTVAGKLVWETRSLGGTATWNTSAAAAKTGMYLVFATDDEANEKFVGKIAVVR